MFPTDRLNVSYNDQRLLYRLIKTAGTLDARTIATEYSPSLNLPARVIEQGRIEVITYDAAERLLSRLIQSTTPPAP